MWRLGSTVIAFCITLALFVLMQAMIGRQEAPIELIKGETEVSLVAAAEQSDAVADDAAVDPEATALPPPPEPAPPVPSTPPPPVAAPTPAPLTPPPAIEPELARIEPGAKPYLGAVTQPKPKPKAKPKPRSKPKPKPKARSKPKQAQTQPSPQAAPRSATRPSTGSGSGDRAASRSNASGRAASPGARAQGKPKPKGVTRAASPISTPRPPYPPAARRAGKEGWVDVQFTITAKGRVSNPRVVGSSPKGVFDQAARRAVQRWRFRPRMVNGKATTQTARQRIYFRLR
jgi:protein TonB